MVDSKQKNAIGKQCMLSILSNNVFGSTGSGVDRKYFSPQPCQANGLTPGWVREGRLSALLRWKIFHIREQNGANLSISQ